MPDNLDYFIPLTKMQRSYWHWGNIPFIDQKKIPHHMYWEYIGDRDHVNGGWWLTETGARRIEYLLGPYAETMVMAWFKTRQLEPKQDPL